MERCKHQNGVLLEFVKASHERDVRDGVMDPRGINGSAFPMRHEYRCSDCGKRWSFGTAPRPKWLQRIYEQFV